MLKRFFIGSASIYSNFSTISKYRRTYVWCILPIILLVNFSPIIAETVNTLRLYQNTYGDTKTGMV